MKKHELCIREQKKLEKEILVIFAGHTCEKLHIDPGHLIVDPNNTLHQVEEILSHSGYGICVPSHS